MRPRERVLAALDGVEVYPVPTDVTHNMIHPLLEDQLTRRLNVQDREGLLRALGADLRWANPKYVGPPLERAPIQPPDPFPHKYASKTIWGYYNLKTYSGAVGVRPLRDVRSVSQVEEYAWPDPGWFDYGVVAPSQAEKAGTDAAPDVYAPVAQWVEDTADYAHVIGDFNPIFGRICDLCGFEVALIKMATEPDVVRAMVDRITDFYEAYYRGIAEAAQGLVDILVFGDDFASQNAMLINPRQWRQYFKASWERLFAVAHKYGMKAQFHACGAIRPVIGDLVEAGMDILQVVQIRLKGMDPAGLKREFGKVLTFHGTVDVQEVLPRYTAEGVRAEVRRLIDIFGPGGRYILSSSHVLREDVPPENVVAMFDEAHSYRARKSRA